jgi:uncharacterized damage-inducible protein DinB
MKTIVILFTLLLSIPALAQQATAKDAFLEKWENSKNYLLEMAELMPEEHYDFKPTERQRSFKEQLLHIKDNMDWLSTAYFSSSEFKKGEKTLAETKAETIETLQNAFDEAAKKIAATSEETLKETVQFFNGPKSKIQILNLLQDHVTHHRGQLIVYLNLKEVEPPRYVGW